MTRSDQLRAPLVAIRDYVPLGPTAMHLSYLLRYLLTINNVQNVHCGYAGAA